MNSQDFRSLQEAYLEVVMNEGLRVFPGGKMQSKATSKRLKALGSELKSKFTTAKGTTERNVVDAKNKKLRSQADKMDKVAREHTPSDSRNKEAKNRGGSSNPRNRMGSDEYAERQFAKNRAMMGMKEELDIYDIILSHLLDEGYAETPEAAERIMVNMSEEWREEIMEGMSMKDFKANRKKLQRKEASADAKKRGHVDRLTGKPYGTEEAASRRRNLNPAERESRRKFAEDPD